MKKRNIFSPGKFWKAVLLSAHLYGKVIYAQSKADLINKLSIALKEAGKTDYWLSLMKDKNYRSCLVFFQMPVSNRK